MIVLRRLWATLIVATKRLVSQRWLSLATAVGLVAAVALIVSIPLYADAVYYRVLQEELAELTDHPPFSFIFHYVGAWAGRVQWQDVGPVDVYLSEQAGPTLGLPQEQMVRYFETRKYQLFPQEDVAYAGVRDPLVWAQFAFASDFPDHVTLLEGHLPAIASPSPEGTVEVLVSQALAFELGLQVGETYVAFARDEAPGSEKTTQIPIRIAGVWAADDPGEGYWFYRPETLSEALFVPEETFLGRISAYLEDEINLGLWYLAMDGSQVYADDVPGLLGRITRVEQRISSMLPNTVLSKVSPKAPLVKYQQSTRQLVVLLYAFSVPIVGLILAFIGLVVGLVVGRQRGEIAILRSRGGTALQIVVIALLEGLLLGALALAAGLPVGAMIARLMGRSRSFLDFAFQDDLRVGITMATVNYGLAVIGLAVAAQLLPTIGAARHTIVTYKQDRARALQSPWWQRYGVDLMLLVPALYGAYLLQQQGGLLLPGSEGGATGNDPFQNPLLFLVPALGAFALTLLVLRFLPWIVSVIAWLLSYVGDVGTLLAARHLARSPGLYAAPLMLLILTLALSTFTASLAETLDTHLNDESFYWVGADMRLEESGQDQGRDRAIEMAFTGRDPDEGDQGPRWLFLPATEYLKIPGVEAATRVASSKATARLGGSVKTGVFLGLERLDFPRVAFWRRDFAPASLGALMNALAVYPNGVLLPRSLMWQHGLSVGDVFQIEADVPSQSNERHVDRVELNVMIMGEYDRFPSWDQEGEGVLFIGNLDYLFREAGGQFPYQVWLKTTPEADQEAIVQGAHDLSLKVSAWDAAPLRVDQVQKRPERQGLFGLLSVGFLAAAFLTVLGFLLYAFFSFRRRFIELGVLRAIGLSSTQMTIFLACELAFLIFTGAAAGTGLGVLASENLIPYLQADTGAAVQALPVVVEIAWPSIYRIYALFGGLFLAALIGLAVLLMRMKIFQAIKLGETV